MSNCCKLNRSRKWGFTVIQNPILNDKGISLKAKGLYCFMQSKPDSWEFSIAGLCLEVAEGKAAVRAAIGELKAAGYLTMEQTRDERGRLSAAIYTLYDTPQFDSPSSDFRQTEKPSVENRTQINKDIKKTDLVNTLPPTPPKGADGFERVWAVYPRRSNRENAVREWRRLQPPTALVETMITAIHRQSQSDQWQRENGRYIPALSRWLRDKRWEDEQPLTARVSVFTDDLSLAMAEMGVSS